MSGNKLKLKCLDALSFHLDNRIIMVTVTESLAKQLYDDRKMKKWGKYPEKKKKNLKQHLS